MQTTDATFAASPISAHLGYTPEGFLVCVGVAIARTAIKIPQYYTRNELGLPGDGMEKVYRLEAEVFDEDFLASLESKPLVSPHPSELLTSDNYSTYVKGHITNPRRGPRLPNGEWSLVADLVVYDRALAEQVTLKHLRDCSVAYKCEYVPFKDGYAQTAMAANHVAIVPRGRAGEEVSIMDSSKDLVSQIQEIMASVKREREEPVAQSVSFRDHLRKTNEAYRSFDDSQKEGQSFGEQAREAGRRMQEKFRPKACATDAAVRQHAEPSEDFSAMARRVGAKMRGR